MSNRKLRTAILDETGMAAEGRLGVTDVLVLSRDLDQEGLLQYAALADTVPELPVADAISESSRQKLRIEGFEGNRGKGAEGGVAGKSVTVVHLGVLREQSIEVDDARLEPLLARGKTVLFVLVDGELKGAIALTEIPRPEAKPAVRVRSVLLSARRLSVESGASLTQGGMQEILADPYPVA